MQRKHNLSAEVTTVDPKSVLWFLWLTLIAPFCLICEVSTNPRMFSLRQCVLLDSEMPPWQILGVLMFVKSVW